MSDGVAIIIWGVVLGSQISLALLGYWYQRNLARRYEVPLSGNFQVAQMLEKYSRMVQTLSLRVNVHLRMPAQVVSDCVLINKTTVYKASLFPNLYTLYQLTLLHKGLRLTRFFPVLQIGLYLAELILAGIGIGAHNWLIWPALVIACFLLISSFVYQAYLTEILDDTLVLAQDLLDLDRYEQKMAFDLVDDLKAGAFLYALKPLVLAIQFILPI